VLVADLKADRYRTKIIKASALLDDTRTLFAHWDVSVGRTENLQRLRDQNVFGKTSRTRVKNVLAIFRQRYLGSPASANALATLVQGGLSSQVLSPVFYFHAAQSDALLHDVVTELLAPMQRHGRVEVTLSQVLGFIQEQVRAGATVSHWGDATSRRVAQGLLATLRDFGVMSGSVKKYLTPLYLPVEAFAYVAFALSQQVGSGERLLKSDDWRLFFLSSELVERFFIEAAMQRLLHYNAAGRIVRVDFPTESIEEYARALAQRTHRPA
jgi:hypothetical protein